MLSTLNFVKFACRTAIAPPIRNSKLFVRHKLSKPVYNVIPLSETFSTCPKRLLKKPPKVGRVYTATGDSSRNFKCLIRPFIFTISVGCFSYVAAAIWQYEGLRKNAKKNMFAWGVGFDEAQNLQELRSLWNRFDPGLKVVASIIALNSAIFLLWRVPSLSGVMMTYFAGNPLGAAPCTSLILSSFSHMSFLHIFANMYVLWSFAPAVAKLLGPEQLAATYVTAAAVSGFGSYVYKIIVQSKVPSLGASGAIFAVLGMVCLSYPDARLSVAFVDQIIPHSFSAESAIKGLIVLDVAGLVLRWGMLDHAAHLSGVLFGLWYVTYGQKWIWRKRDYVVKKWRSIRRKYSGD